MIADPQEIARILPYLTDEEQAELDQLITQELWMPQVGPQMDAYNSEADIVFYGGSAGGGKTDLLIGLCTTRHTRSVIFRREGTQLQGIIDRMADIMGDKNGFNGQDYIWRMPKEKRQIEFGSCKDAGSERKWQGRPHDLIGFDEITHFLESQFRYLSTWNRTTLNNQRCRIVCTGNPPTDSTGDWVRQFWGPWLDKNHPDPAEPGELRWYTTIDGEDVECAGPEPIEHEGNTIHPRSRTFIPALVRDNQYLMTTDYEATLQALPEPLRSQMLHGDFSAGMDDDPWQVIPTEWVRLAQDRWEDYAIKDRGPLDSIGVDPARGGVDETVVSKRYGCWFSELMCYPGAQTPNGPTVAAVVVPQITDRAPIHVDVIGIGASVYDHLDGTGLHTIPINGSEKSDATDKTHALRMFNYRAEMWWKMREDLDPQNHQEIALPPGSELRADLCAPRWTLASRGVKIEKKDETKKRIGRSPDKGDAVVMANIKTNKKSASRGGIPGDIGRGNSAWMGM